MFFRRRVTCLDCGFLACDGCEVDIAARALLATGGRSATMPSQEYLDALCCHRSQWIDHDLCGKPALYVVSERRHCKEFVPYKPGVSPVERLKRLLDSEQMRDQVRVQFRYTFLAALLGAALALIGQTAQQWLSKSLGLSTPSNAGAASGSTTKTK